MLFINMRSFACNLYQLFLTSCAIVVLFLLFGILSVKALNKPQDYNTERTKISHTQPKVIGILMPMDHTALREIVAGFEETLTSLSEVPLEFKVQNAQGDMNIQRSIIQQFVNQKVDLIVPIGTTATQMAAKLTSLQPIVSLAALQSKTHSDRITGVLDEIGPEKPLKFLAQVIPNLNKITLVHSASEKIFPEIEELMIYAKTHNLKVQKLMIQSLSDIYTISRQLDSDSQIIFVLKDHLVVSGIRTLVQEAKKKQIPVMTTDEGSVKEGAAFALGVEERLIGEQGARLAHKLLSGESIQNLPFETLDRLTLFYNEGACLDQGVSIEHIKVMAKKSGYEIKKY